MHRRFFRASLFALGAVCGSLAPVAASAADGQILITHSKALAGNITAGDAAGYPVTLSASGSYKLASDLLPGKNQDAIVVTSADVTIDLNGFKLSGGPAGGVNNARFGIFGKGDRLTVKNGTIGAFKSSGIHAPGRHYLIVENVRVINGGLGIDSNPGTDTRIQDSTIASNADTGIKCGKSCHVEGSIVSGNGGRGIWIVSGTVLGNTVVSNLSYGIQATGPTSDIIVGFGNNTLVKNNPGGSQTTGPLLSLTPNACSPTC